MNAVTRSHRISFFVRALAVKCYLDIAKTLAARQLGKPLHAKPLGAGKGANARVAAVAKDDATKARPLHELHNLRAKCLAAAHDKFRRG